MCFFSKTISSLHYLWPVCSGTQIGGWNAKPQLSVSSSQPSRRNPLTTPLASRSLHHLSLLGIMITSPGSGVDTHAAFLNSVHCNFNVTNCIFKTPLVPVVVRPPVPNILSSSVPSFSSSPKPRNISHSWIWCYHVMMDQFMSRTFLSPIWSSFQHDQHEKSFASYFIFRSDSRSYLTLISTMTRE